MRQFFFHSEGRQGSEIKNNYVYICLNIIISAKPKLFALPIMEMGVYANKRIISVR